MPSKLYRYRPLDDALLERELDAVRHSYLFSPSFKSMNDPMEAFLEVGGPYDHIVDLWMRAAERSTKDIYVKLEEFVNSLALISFSETYKDLPLWAYYASNFSGMCLEFDTPELYIGDLQNEKLRQVSYALNSLPPLDWRIINFDKESFKEAILARLSRKRVEWEHEKEWRFITGQVGPRHYLDDALRRVFLGPRIKPEHAKRICETLDRRPVEVLQGEVKGFRLEFRTIQSACTTDKCERLGRGKFDFGENFQSEEGLRPFMLAPFEMLVNECRRIASRPNMDEILNVGISVNNKEWLYIQAAYKLRSGRTIYHKRYFDRHFRPQEN
jgi:hypothetical protein